MAGNEVDLIHDELNIILFLYFILYFIPILSDTAAQPSRPARLPPAVAIRYADAKDVVTKKINKIK